MPIVRLAMPSCSNAPGTRCSQYEKSSPPMVGSTWRKRSAPTSPVITFLARRNSGLVFTVGGNVQLPGAPSSLGCVRQSSSNEVVVRLRVHPCVAAAPARTDCNRSLR